MFAPRMSGETVARRLDEWTTIEAVAVEDGTAVGVVVGVAVGPGVVGCGDGVGVAVGTAVGLGDPAWLGVELGAELGGAVAPAVGVAPGPPGAGPAPPPPLQAASMRAARGMAKRGVKGASIYPLSATWCTAGNRAGRAV
jgi:hypothetical protein